RDSASSVRHPHNLRSRFPGGPRGLGLPGRRDFCRLKNCPGPPPPQRRSKRVEQRPAQSDQRCSKKPPPRENHLPATFGKFRSTIPALSLTVIILSAGTSF